MREQRRAELCQNQTHHGEYGAFEKIRSILVHSEQWQDPLGGPVEIPPIPTFLAARVYQRLKEGWKEGSQTYAAIACQTSAPLNTVAPVLLVPHCHSHNLTSAVPAASRTLSSRSRHSLIIFATASSVVRRFSRNG